MNSRTFTNSFFAHSILNWRILIFFLLVSISSKVSAQPNLYQVDADNFLQIAYQTKNDTVKVLHFKLDGQTYSYINTDIAIHYYKKAFAVIEK
jgi:hypothetical protein